jgi:hypothetical protein
VFPEKSFSLDWAAGYDAKVTLAPIGFEMTKDVATNVAFQAMNVVFQNCRLLSESSGVRLRMDTFFFWNRARGDLDDITHPFVVACIFRSQVNERR